MNIIHNERLKLLATFPNGLGIALFGVGGLALVFSSLYNANGPTLYLMMIGIVCFWPHGHAFGWQHRSRRMMQP